MAQQPSVTAHWRDSARPARFLFIDAKAAFPFFLFLIHIRLWTFILALVIISFFTILARFGFSIEVFLRIVRSFLAGPRKISRPWWTN